MSLDQSAYPEHQWDPAMAHAVEDCPSPGQCDNGHPNGLPAGVATSRLRRWWAAFRTWPIDPTDLRAEIDR